MFDATSSVGCCSRQQRSRTPVYLSSVAGAGPQFFLVGARSKIHSALVSCMCVDNGSAQRGADGVAGVSPWSLVARYLLNILSATVF